jgi:hypothetical protein
MCGTIKRIYLQNFMCHKQFTIDLSQINFISGRNGSMCIPAPPIIDCSATRDERVAFNSTGSPGGTMQYQCRRQERNTHGDHCRAGRQGARHGARHVVQGPDPRRRNVWQDFLWHMALFSVKRRHCIE